MTTFLPACRTLYAWFALAALVLATPATGHASGAQRRAPANSADIEGQFAALALQRPWECAAPSAAVVLTQGDQCAWQNRLRLRRWGSMQESSACVSEPARQWSIARSLPGALPAPAAWRSHWQANSVQGRHEGEEFIVIVRRDVDGRWSAAEWRWKPSTRLATRNWQAGRWALLAARAAQLRAPVPALSGPPEERMLRTVLENNLGKRASETTGDVWRWEAGAVCLRADLQALGAPQLQLPYALDDSRLEQRAAMQLHLARRFPQATWLTPFRLLDYSPQKKGGAKFYALWSENGLLKGQLWMPTKGKGKLVRVRIDTALPAVRPAQPATTSHAAALIERELAALATLWNDTYE